jgi:hypothetical protein
MSDKNNTIDDAERLERLRKIANHDDDGEFLLRQIDARDADLRDARAKIEDLQSDAANDAGDKQSCKRAIAELCDVLGIERRNDPWPEFIERLRLIRYARGL